MPVLPDSPADSVELLVASGRPLRVALDERVRLRRVGQPVTATLVEPIYAYDRVVIPAGAKVRGRVSRLDDPPKKARVRALLGGDFTPHRQVVLQFDSIQLADGRELPVRTVVGPGIERVTLQVSANDPVEVDDEGGTLATSSKTRFIAPALALMALRGSIRREGRGFDGDPDDSLPGRASGGLGPRGVGGFFGWGLAGTAVSLVSRPAGIALGVVGAARTAYGAVFGKGREVSFPVYTPIQVQLAPGRRPRS